MERSIRSRTSSTSSVRSPAVPGTPAPTPARAGPGNRAPSPDQLAASLSRLRAERALSTPATPAPTPNPALPHLQHNLHPDILDSLARLGGDEGIASCSVPGTPQPTPFSPSPGHQLQLDPGQVAASIARLREEGVSTVNTQPTTPAGTPAGYLHPLAGGHHLGVIPEHLAEGINNSLAGRGQDEGLESGSNPATPTPTPFSPSPALHHSLLAEQLTAGINRLRVETDGMSSGGSTGLPATPAPTPFSHGPGGVRPEDLAASISRLSVIQEADTGPSINVLDASGSSDPLNTSTSSGNNPNNLSNYFGTPQNAGESIFDQISTPRSRQSSETKPVGQGQGDFTDVTINTPVKRLAAPSGQTSASPIAKTPERGSKKRESPAPVTPKPRQELAPEVRTEPPRPESPSVPRSGASGLEEELSVSWAPSAGCREILANLAATPGTFYPSRDQLSLPGLSSGSEQGDPVRDGVAKYQGEGEASKRQVMGCDSVTADTRGLIQLISLGNFRSGVNMTAQLLEMYGQGQGKTGQLSKHSPTSLQIWWIRLALLVKLRQFTTAEAEAAAFGVLDTPDLYYQYYPELHPNKRGSMAPWSLRLLLAELPAYNNKQVVAMNKLLRLLRQVRQMISNLEAGLAPDGEVILSEAEEKQRLGLKIWLERERQILHSLVNSCLLHQDYEAAVKSLDMLREVEAPERLASLLSAQGRVYLQLGSIGLADRSFTEAAMAREAAGKSSEAQVEALLDSAFLAIGQGQFGTAAEMFTEAEKLVGSSSTQSKMINNNIAVCLLYVGRLKEGLARLETDITQDPANIQVRSEECYLSFILLLFLFQGNIMLNLSTLYELESSYAMQKKIGMLGLVSQYSTDSFNMAMLKL